MVGWAYVFESSSQILRKLRQVFEQFSGYFMLLVGRVSVFPGTRATSGCPAKLTTFRDYETSKDQLTWLSGWLEGGERTK